MLISPAAVAALSHRYRRFIRNIGDYSAGFGVLYKGAARNGNNKVGRAFARTTARTAFLSRFGGLFSFIAEVGKGGQVTVRLKNYVASSAAVTAVRAARREILLPKKGNRTVAAVTRL